MKTSTKIILVNLAALVALVFVYPEAMVSPGPVNEGHRDIGTDCFACHTPLFGAASSKCTECHRIEDIGRLTTRGDPIAEAKTEVPFHQELREQDCVACHSEHRGVAILRTAQRFSHALLEPPTRERCVACHAAPGDRTHRELGEECRRCHSTERWTPATFDHADLAPATREQCGSCHAAPADALHQGTGERCGECHQTRGWTPATFDHDRYFRFDRAHQTECVTCHEGNDYSRYTCYGCHEHSAWNIRGEHLEEGIRDFENCVECHRSGDEEEAEWRMRDRSRGEMPRYRGEGHWKYDD